jgi:DNA-binding phage protein
MSATPTARPRRKTNMGRKRAEPQPGTPGHILSAIIAEKAGKATLDELADRADMPRAKLSEILSGKTTNPGILTVGRILAAVGADFGTYHRASKKFTQEGTNPS